MTTETETHEAEHGMSNAGYVRIALILAAITALEVSTYYVDFGPFFMPSLMIMMVIKFLMVVSYFMHLKFDNRLFSWLFYAGLILAIIVYVIALSTFKFFVS
ncbi:MAG: cytochrome C oxidase subunit IV family protein [Ilumatobacteraceae bacterium]|jgi:cytochrome c oxidase subunit 4